MQLAAIDFIEGDIQSEMLIRRLKLNKNYQKIHLEAFRRYLEPLKDRDLGPSSHHWSLPS
jgi:hypothetical protein